jgi:Na+-driven multidrug efflux pump
MYARARAMGFYPRGVLAKRAGAAGADDVALRGAWGRDTAAVALRSVLNNSREFVTLFVALRLGTNAGAVVTVFGSVSALASGVPFGVSTAMMSEGSRQLGLGRHDVVLWYLRAFHAFGLGCGCAFALVLSQQREAVVATYSGATEYAGFAELAAEAWPLFVAYQPVLALVSVLGPMVAATQHYAYWGGAGPSASCSSSGR